MVNFDNLLNKSMLTRFIYSKISVSSTNWGSFNFFFLTMLTIWLNLLRLHAKTPYCELEAWKQAILLRFLLVSYSITFTECPLRGWEGKKVIEDIWFQMPKYLQSSGKLTVLIFKPWKLMLDWWYYSEIFLIQYMAMFLKMFSVV